jgi:hypothetical protein
VQLNISYSLPARRSWNEVNFKAAQEIITILEQLENQQIALDEIKVLLKSKLAT